MVFPSIVPFVKLPLGNSSDSRLVASTRAKFRPRLSSRSDTPEMPANDRTTITNASRRACTRAYTRASACTRLGAAPFLLAVVAARGGRRSSNSREIQNKRSRRLRAIATGRRDNVEDRRGRGRVTAHALYLRCIPKPPTANHPRTHIVV